MRDEKNRLRFRAACRTSKNLSPQVATPWAFCCHQYSSLIAILLSDPLILRQIVANRAFCEIGLVVDVVEIACRADYANDIPLQIG